MPRQRGAENGSLLWQESRHLGVCGKKYSSKQGPGSRPHPVSLTFAVWQVGKTVSKADDSIEATPWWLGHIFIQSHPVGFFDDWDQEGEEGSGWHHGPSGTHLHQVQPCLSFPLKTHGDSPSS